MGIHAPDVEAYDVFSDIYTPMILDYHGLKSPADINVIYKKVYLSFLSYTRFSGSILKRSNFNESNLNQTLRKKNRSNPNLTKYISKNIRSYLIYCLNFLI